MINWIKRHRVLFVVIVIAFLGLGYGGLELTMQPFFCNSCHEMNRVCSSWKTASHAEVGCMECHAEPGLVGLIKAKMTAMKSPVYHFFASQEKIKEALKHHTETPDSACLKCHPKVLDVDRVVNIQTNHRKHYNLPGADCQKCHENIGHCGAIPENDLQQHMKLCLECHEKNSQSKAPQKDACDVCHIGEKEMLLGKGGVEIDDIESLMPEQTCTDCHDSEESFAPSEQTCVDCHDESYPAYIKEWQGEVQPELAKANEKYKSAKAVIEKAGRDTELIKLWDAANHNYMVVKHDGSKGAHNADYASALLENASAKFDQIIAKAQTAQK